MVKAPALPPQFPPGHRKPDGFVNITINTTPMQTTLAPAPSAARTTRVPSPAPSPSPPRRAHHSWPLAVLHSYAFAVGRDVPSRRIAPSPCAAWHRASSSCAFAVGRDVPIAPPRHRRGARLGIPRPFVFPRRRPSSRITRAARCSAAGPPGSRRHLPTRITRAARWGHRALPPLRPISPPTSLPPHRVLHARVPLR